MRMQLMKSAHADAKARATGPADRRPLSAASIQQRVMRVAALLLGCVALVNVLTFARTMGVLTASDVLQIDHQSEQQRLRKDEGGVVSEDTWATIVAAVDAVDGSEDQLSSSPIKIHYTAKERAPSTETEWRAINGDSVEILYYSDADSEALVNQMRPQFLETYRTKLSPVERADYFRYLVLWVHGGVYVDSDVSFITPVDKWLSTFGWDVRSNGRKRQLHSIDVIVGVEFPSPQTHYPSIGWLPIQFTQFVIAGGKDSAVLKRVVLYIEECVARIERGDDVEITIERTGPAAFTRAILDAIQSGGVVSPSVEKANQNQSSDARYPRALLPIDELEKSGQLIPWRRPRSESRSPLSGTEAVGSILVLPYRAFAYHQFHHIAKAPVLTRHFYENSWRDSTK